MRGERAAAALRRGRPFSSAKIKFLDSESRKVYPRDHNGFGAPHAAEADCRYTQSASPPSKSRWRPGRLSAASRLPSERGPWVSPTVCCASKFRMRAGRTELRELSGGYLATLNQYSATRVERIEFVVGEDCRRAAPPGVGKAGLQTRQKPHRRTRKQWQTQK